MPSTPSKEAIAFIAASLKIRQHRLEKMEQEPIRSRSFVRLQLLDHTPDFVLREVELEEASVYCRQIEGIKVDRVLAPSLSGKRRRGRHYTIERSGCSVPNAHMNVKEHRISVTIH